RSASEYQRPVAAIPARRGRPALEERHGRRETDGTRVHDERRLRLPDDYDAPDDSPRADATQQPVRIFLSAATTTNDEAQCTSPRTYAPRAATIARPIRAAPHRAMEKQHRPAARRHGAREGQPCRVRVGPPRDDRPRPV